MQIILEEFKTGYRFELGGTKYSIEASENAWGYVFFRRGKEIKRRIQLNRDASKKDLQKLLKEYLKDYGYIVEEFPQITVTAMNIKHLQQITF